MTTPSTCLLLLLFPALLMAQQNPASTSQVRTDLLEKSNRQKATGFLMLGLGAAALAGGAAMYNANVNLFGDEDDTSITIFMVGGSLAIWGSLPFFIAASKNKQNTMEMGAGIKWEHRPPGAVPGRAGQIYPAMALRFPIR